MGSQRIYITITQISIYLIAFIAQHLLLLSKIARIGLIGIREMMKKAVVKNVDPDKTACVLIVSELLIFGL